MKKQANTTISKMAAISGCLLVSMIHGTAHAFTVAPLLPSKMGSLSTISQRFSPPAAAVAAMTELRMIGNIFGGEVSDSADSKVDMELASFPNLAPATSTPSDNDVVFSGLADYLDSWSRPFDDDPKSMKLTTPVIRSKSEPNSSVDGNVVKSEGIRLVFKSTSTGYKNKDEEDAGGSYESSKPKSTPSENKKKEESKKNGGVEILVEQLQNGSVQVRARRCETDDDTLIKEMSEETITNELKKAVKAWKTK